MRAKAVAYYMMVVNWNFSIKAGVRQGRLLSQLTKEDNIWLYEWHKVDLVDYLEDINYADDMALLTNTHSQVQANTSKPSKPSHQN